MNLPAAKRNHPPEQILEQKSAKVAEVRGIVDSWAARVHADGFTVCRREILDAAGEGIVEAEVRHGLQGNNNVFLPRLSLVTSVAMSYDVSL